MKNTDPSEIWIMANGLRSKYPLWSSLDSICCILIAKLISKNKSFSDKKEMNDILRKKFPELICESDIASEIIQKFQELKISPKEISSFINRSINTKRIGVYDFRPDSITDLSKLIRLKKDGKVADLNCTSSTFLKEVIKQNEFKGEVHLYSNNKVQLKLAVLNIYPINKNIKLHFGDERSINKSREQFDFIYTMPPFVSPRFDTTDIYISNAKMLLKPEGKMLLLVPNRFLFSARDNKIRHNLLENYYVDGIISLANAFRPYTAVSSSLILLENLKQPNKKTFVAHLNFLDETFEDIKSIIDAYFSHKSGKTIENVSPLTNRVDSLQLFENFNVKRFDPRQQRLEKKLSNKFNLIELGEVCEILRGTFRYGSKDYLKKSLPDSKRLIRIKDIKNGIVDLTDIKYVKIKDPNDNLTKEQDLLLSISGTIGKVGIVDSETQGSLVSHGQIILRVKKHQIDPIYLKHILQSKYVITQFENLSAGATILHLSSNLIKKVKIPKIPLEKQKKLIKKIDDLSKHLNELKKKTKSVEDELQSELDGVLDYE